MLTFFQIMKKKQKNRMQKNGKKDLILGDFDIKQKKHRGF
jgi:hypothetical protein